MNFMSDEEIFDWLFKILIVAPMLVVAFLLLASGIGWLIGPAVERLVDFMIYLGTGEWP